MKTRLAVGLILLVLLIGCGNSGPTAPRDVNLEPSTPTVTPAQAPQPTPTPGRCHPVDRCSD